MGSRIIESIRRGYYKLVPTNPIVSVYDIPLLCGLSIAISGHKSLNHW